MARFDATGAVRGECARSEEARRCAVKKPGCHISVAEACLAGMGMPCEKACQRCSREYAMCYASVVTIKKVGCYECYWIRKGTEANVTKLPGPVSRRVMV